MLYGGNGLQWVDGETIGRLLYPDASSPSNRICNVLNRNKEQFTRNDTLFLKVDTDYNWSPDKRDIASQIETACLKVSTLKQEVCFFSVPDGLMKICHFSRSKNALPVQQRVIDIWKVFLKDALPKPQPTLLALAHIPKWQHGKGEEIRKLAHQEGVTEMTIRRRIEKVKKGEPVNRNLKGFKKPYVHHKYHTIYYDAIKLKKEGLNALNIAEKLGIPDKTLYRWFKKPLLN